jgi:transcriptional regulator with XRE-family HTH domain
MALFFDAAWFDARLAARGLDRAALAAAAGVTPDALSAIFKDQEEPTPAQLSAFAELLGEPRDEVARRCGITTQRPRLTP